MEKLDIIMMQDCFYSSIDPVKRAAIKDSAKAPHTKAPDNMLKEPLIVEFEPGFQVDKLKV